MGIFNKIKNIFTKSNDVEVYDKGLEKTRREFVSKLGNLSKKYKFVNEDYFEELLEEIREIRLSERRFYQKTCY